MPQKFDTDNLPAWLSYNHTYAKSDIEKIEILKGDQSQIAAAPRELLYDCGDLTLFAKRHDGFIDNPFSGDCGFINLSSHRTITYLYLYPGGDMFGISYQSINNAMYPFTYIGSWEGEEIFEEDTDQDDDDYCPY